MGSNPGAGLGSGGAGAHIFGEGGGFPDLGGQLGGSRGGKSGGLPVLICSPLPRPVAQSVLALTVRFGSVYFSHQFASFPPPAPPASYVPFSGCNPVALGGCVEQGMSTKGSTCTSAELTLSYPPPPPLPCATITPWYFVTPLFPRACPTTNAW